MEDSSRSTVTTLNSALEALPRPENLRGFAGLYVSNLTNRFRGKTGARVTYDGPNIRPPSGDGSSLANRFAVDAFDTDSGERLHMDNLTDALRERGATTSAKLLQRTSKLLLEAGASDVMNRLPYPIPGPGIGAANSTRRAS
jgi:hypothetical protein